MSGSRPRPKPPIEKAGKPQSVTRSSPSLAATSMNRCWLSATICTSGWMRSQVWMACSANSSVSGGETHMLSAPKYSIEPPSSAPPPYM